jgi:hypothetical protein
MRTSRNCLLIQRRLNSLPSISRRGDTQFTVLRSIQYHISSVFLHHFEHTLSGIWHEPKCMSKSLARVRTFNFDLRV